MQLYKEKKFLVSWTVSLLKYFRDATVQILPIRHLPACILKMLYGSVPDFIFFVHARRREDIYVALPFLVPLRKIIGRKSFAKLTPYLPPFVLDKVTVNQGGKKNHGLVVTSLFLPETLLKNNKRSFKESVRGLNFISKICQKQTVVGLGGLWPMVTRRGLALKKYGKDRDLILTNGHCGTLASLYLTIEKIASISDIPMTNMKISILGSGKMGTNLARVLYGKVATITLVDINEKRLDVVEKQLLSVAAATDIQKYHNKDDVGEITNILRNNHIVVSTTSNLTRILKPQQIPSDTILIDDSRPEGIPRTINKNGSVVLEGGLIKIKNLMQNYDFGFGVDDNVFGCLAESYILAADNENKVKPTLGDVNFSNFKIMLEKMSSLGVSVGDFKTCDAYIKNGQLADMLKRKYHLESTIPFKNICWIFKVDDLNLD